MIARLAIALLCAVATSTGATAAVRLCQSTVSSGEVTGLNETKARAAALKVWMEKVRTVFGEPFTAWRLAEPKAVKCIKRSQNFACVVLARPCTIRQAAPHGLPGLRRPEQGV